MSRVPAVLRVLVLGLLVVAVVFPEAWGERGAAGRVAWVGAGVWTDSLLVGAAPALVARRGTEAPGAGEMEALAALAGRSPLVAVLPPGEAAAVEADAPARTVAGRAAGLAFRVRGAPGDTVTVRVADEAGPIDSARVRLDAAGRGGGAFRVRPPRPGWREWTVRAGEAEARTGAWADSAGAPRVRVRAGVPGWESRFVVRALEESGAAVDVVQPLGRGLFVDDAAAAPPSPGVDGYDAVVVLDGAETGEAERRALAEYAGGGGGVLLVGDAAAGAAGFGLGRAGTVGSVEGTRIRWSPPAELAALPADRVRTAVLPLSSLAAGATAAAGVDGAALLALRPLGRGRVAALGVTETWRWRMEAGRVAEHRAFWRALVDWLASAPRGAVGVRLDEALGPVGAAVEVRVFAPAAAPAPSVRLMHPGGARERLALEADPARPGVLRGAFVPASPGVYALAVEGGAPLAGFRAMADTAEVARAGAWARLALLAERSGGGMVPADSLRAEVERRLGGEVGGGAGWAGWRWVLLALVVVLAGAEWAVRRVSGRV